LLPICHYAGTIAWPGGKSKLGVQAYSLRGFTRTRPSERLERIGG